MTVDLFVWKLPTAHEPVLAGSLLEEHLQGPSRFEPSPQLVRFAEEMLGPSRTARMAGRRPPRKDGPLRSSDRTG
jgi:hypothetical protein